MGSGQYSLFFVCFHFVRKIHALLLFSCTMYVINFPLIPPLTSIIKFACFFVGVELNMLKIYMYKKSQGKKRFRVCIKCQVYECRLVCFTLSWFPQPLPPQLITQIMVLIRSWLTHRWHKYSIGNGKQFRLRHPWTHIIGVTRVSLNRKSIEKFAEIPENRTPRGINADNPMSCRMSHTNHINYLTVNTFLSGVLINTNGVVTRTWYQL